MFGSSGEVFWWVWQCACLSVREDISGTTRSIFTNFSVHVAYGCRLVLLWQGVKIPRGRGSFGGFPPHWRCTVRRSLQKDHSIGNNVMQQKWSFHQCHMCCKWDRPGRGWRECTGRAVWSMTALLWSPYVIGQTIIFSSCLFLSYSSSCFFPRLISAAGDWMFTILWHMVWP